MVNGTQTCERIRVSIYIQNRTLVVFYAACFASDSGDFNAWRTRDLPSFFYSGSSSRNYQDVGSILMTSRCFSGHEIAATESALLLSIFTGHSSCSINHALGTSQSARYHSISSREDDNSCCATQQQIDVNLHIFAIVHLRETERERERE